MFLQKLLATRFNYRSQLYLLLLPYLAGITLLVVIPTLITVALSFTQYDIFSAPQWNDFANFRNFLSDRLFQRALYNSLPRGRAWQSRNWRGARKWHC